MLRALWIVVFLVNLTAGVWGLSMPELDALIESGRLDEAAREIKQLLKLNDEDPEVLQRHGFLLLRQSADEKDAVQAKELRRLARLSFIRAQTNGNTNELVALLVDSLPVDGGEQHRYSANEDVHLLMKRAEEQFRKGEYAEASVLFGKAEELEPTLYHAPLYQGDCYLRLGLMKRACASYRRATVISPNTETAYRYWGNALMKQGAMEEALAQYCHAVVADPSSKIAWRRGLQSWVQTTGSGIAMPRIRPRATVSENGQEIIVLSNSSPEALAPWLVYASVRLLWRSKNFSESHPGQSYQRTLEEEVDALRHAARLFNEMRAEGKSPQDRDLELLTEIEEEDLLEAYVLFAGGESDFAKEFEGYRERHREKLVRFMVEHVVQRESL